MKKIVISSKENPRAEIGLEIYKKQRNYINLSSMKDFIEEGLGLDLTRNTRFVHMDKPIDELISKQFKKQEEINYSVVNNYL